MKRSGTLSDTPSPIPPLDFLTISSIDFVHCLFSETPESSLGQVVPIFYTEIVIEDISVDELLGGFSSTIIPWDPTSEFTILIVDDVSYAQSFETDLLFVEAFAYDEDTGVVDDRVFPYTIDGAPTDGDPTDGAPTDGSPAGAPTEEPSYSLGRFDNWLALMLVSFLVPFVVLT